MAQDLKPTAGASSGKLSGATAQTTAAGDPSAPSNAKPQLPTEADAPLPVAAPWGPPATMEVSALGAAALASATGFEDGRPHPYARDASSPRPPPPFPRPAPTLAPARVAEPGASSGAPGASSETGSLVDWRSFAPSKQAPSSLLSREAPGSAIIEPVTSPAPARALESAPQASPARARDLPKSAAWKELSSVQQRQLQAVLEGKTHYSEQGRKYLDWLCEDKSFAAASPSAQAARALKAVADAVKEGPFAPSQLGSTARPVPTSARPSSVSAGTPTDAASFGIGPPALRFEVSVHGRTIPVFSPDDAIPIGGHQQFSAQEIGQILANIPERVARKIERVVLDRWPRIDRGSQVTMAMFGEEGEARVYPVPVAKTGTRSLEDGICSMIHEAAHAWAVQLFGSARSEGLLNELLAPRWREWERARADDALPVSGWGRSAPGAQEDFAETVNVYVVSKLTETFDEYRALFPHRFKLLDEYFARSDEDLLSTVHDFGA